MFFRIIERDQVPDLVRAFAEHYEVVGPIKRGTGWAYAKIDDPADLQLDFGITKQSPKKYFFPTKEELMRFSLSGEGEVDDSVEVTPRVLFGVHPCDIDAFAAQDDVFLGDGQPDPYYTIRRDNTVIVGVSCTPSPECFCKVWGSDEVHVGYDLFLHDLGDRYLVSIRSILGARILNAAEITRQATLSDHEDLKRITAERDAMFGEMPNIDQLPLLMDALWHDEMWDELGERCISCGACAFVCPCCNCFDVSDVVSEDGETGSRVRRWDSCNFESFSAVAGGHNFHPTSASRVRCRFYHKFLGFLTKHDRFQCTGCGRCEIACPVDIHPKVIIDAVQRRREA